jgi:hypothetical protein
LNENEINFSKLTDYIQVLPTNAAIVSLGLLLVTVQAVAMSDKDFEAPFCLTLFDEKSAPDVEGEVLLDVEILPEMEDIPLM